MLEPRPHLYMSLLVVVAAVAAAAPWMFSAAPADANHPWYTTDSKHLTSQHSASTGHGQWDEDFCVDDLTGATGDATAYAMVYDAVLSQWPRWDLMSGSEFRVDIYGIDVSSTGPCGSINITDAEIRYWINSSACSPRSCALHAGPNPAFSPKHYDFFNVHLLAGHTPPGNPTEYRKNINHETGHVWGLKDPDYTNQFYNGCFSSWGVGYYSVMHQYGDYCNTSGGYAVPTVVAPQGADFENVIAFQLPSH